MKRFLQVSAVMIGLVLACAPASAQSPGEKGGSSPKPLTPQERIELARQEFDSAKKLVSQSGRRVAEAVRSLNAAQQRYDTASEQARRELVKHPALVEAGREVIEARGRVRELREKALMPLSADVQYQETVDELNRTSRRLDELRRERREADRKRLPFAKEDVLKIYTLAQQVLELEDQIATVEAAALDDHEGYRQAVKELEKAMEESAKTMKDVVRLVRGGRELKDSLVELQGCYAELNAANNAIRAARGRQERAATSLGQMLSSK